MQILLFMADLTAVNSFTDAVKWSLHCWADKSARIKCALEHKRSNGSEHKDIHIYTHIHFKIKKLYYFLSYDCLDIYLLTFYL